MKKAGRINGRITGIGFIADEEDELFMPFSKEDSLHN